MTSDRAQAYGRVMKILQDLGPAKLQADEQERIRTAADTLLFAEDLVTDQGAIGALADMETLAHSLVEADRWTSESAGELLDALGACGPVTPVA